MLSIPEVTRPKKRKLSVSSSSEEQKVEPRNKRLRRMYETCAICFEDNADCSLDCCKHQYCLECIQQWVTKSESRCPQCKKEVGELRHKDGDMKVEEKNQGDSEEEEDYYDEEEEEEICDVCHERVQIDRSPY